MHDGPADQASGYGPPPTLVPHKETILPEATPDPAPVPVALSKTTSPAGGRRSSWWLGVGCAVGVAVGVLLTNMVNNMLAYTYFYPVQSNKPSVQVFNELNDMRLELNKLNEEKKLQEQQKDDAIRNALSAVKSVAPLEGDKPKSPPTPALQPGGVAAMQPGGVAAVQPGGVADIRPPSKPRDGFAEIDEEIERLEKMQKTINNILDLFTPPTKEKERTKDR
jgi:hypothetical protein